MQDWRLHIKDDGCGDANDTGEGGAGDKDCRDTENGCDGNRDGTGECEI